MTDLILATARKLAVADLTARGWSADRIRNTAEGWYDTGSLVTRWIPEATAEVLRNRQEAEPE